MALHTVTPRPPATSAPSHPAPARLRATCALSLAIALLGAAPARAAPAACQGPPDAAFGVQAAFIEGAPTDRLEVRNTSRAGWRIVGLAWDLGPSRGRLIFDVTAQGAGVQVFQPLRVVSGGASAARPASVPAVRDGDTALTLAFERFDPGQTFAATMDLDDSLDQQATIIASSEISGATLGIEFAHADGRRSRQTLVFDEQARAGARRVLRRRSEPGGTRRLRRAAPWDGRLGASLRASA